MLEEEGVVKSVAGNRALVVTDRKADCEHCSASKACLIKDGGGEMIAQVLNPVGAAEGDRVKITLPEGALLKSSFFLYLVPVLGLMTGCVLGYALGKNFEWNTDASAIAGGFLLLGISFFGVYFFDRRFKEKSAFLPKIEGILDRAGNDISKEEQPYILHHDEPGI